MDKVYAPKTLELAWEKVEANRGAAGVEGLPKATVCDWTGQSVERFAAQAEGFPKETVCDWTKYLAELNQDLKAGRYRPEAVKRVAIPKGDGTTRPLGIPTVKDRIVQTAVKLVIEPIFEVQFLATSYGLVNPVHGVSPFGPACGCPKSLPAILSTRARLQGCATRSRSTPERRLHLRGGCRAFQAISTAYRTKG